MGPPPYACRVATITPVLWRADTDKGKPSLRRSRSVWKKGSKNHTRAGREGFLFTIIAQLHPEQNSPFGL